MAETKGPGPRLRLSPQSTKDLAAGEGAVSGKGQRHLQGIWHQYNICRSLALGTVLAGDEFLEAFVKAMMSTFADELAQASKIAKTNHRLPTLHSPMVPLVDLPSANYTWDCPFDDPLEHIIFNKFIPIITR